MAADLKGCTEIVSVDLKPKRLAKAEELGATATVDPEDVDDVVEAARELTDGGPNYPLETTGVPEVAEQAVGRSSGGARSASSARRRWERKPATTSPT